MHKIPEVGSVWTHKYGEVYTVVMLVNEHSVDTENDPIMVVYEDAGNQYKWAIPLYQWLSSMTPQIDDSVVPPEVGEIWRDNTSRLCSVRGILDAPNTETLVVYAYVTDGFQCTTLSEWHERMTKEEDEHEHHSA